MAKGPGSGISNNPIGKPKGTKNKLSLSVKEMIIQEVNNDFDDYMIKMKSLTARDYVRSMTELIKLVVPRPLNDEESDSMNTKSEFIKRMFQ